MPDPFADAVRGLLRGAHLVGPDGMPHLADDAGRALGAERALLWLVDYDQVLLVPLPLAGRDDPTEPVAVEGTLAGRAFSDVVQHVSQSGDRPVLWTPLLDGTERLGVLQLELPAGSGVGEQLRADALDVAALLADLVVTRGRCGDSLERARRRRPMTVPAELQWRQLPPLTFVAPRVAVAGVLAPAAEVAGDTFDYALDGDVLHVALLDAMGHGMEAALLSAVAVSTLRSSRRQGLGLADTVRRIDRELADHFGGDRFVTGTFGRLDIATGIWTWAACGHPPGLVLRGGRAVKELQAQAGPPLGLDLLPAQLELASERLEPGDRLLLYTDGVVEARDVEGAFFGVERLVDFVGRQESGARPVAETLRRLVLAILEHQEGALQDDATALIVEWLSDQPAVSLPPGEALPGQVAGTSAAPLDDGARPALRGT